MTMYYNKGTTFTYYVIIFCLFLSKLGELLEELLHVNLGICESRIQNIAGKLRY